MKERWNEKNCNIIQPIIDTLKGLKIKKENVIIAIDGKCGSGKTTLAHFLKEKIDCNIFHMDDYFLPFEMKTQERLSKPGGNVHYERFYEEVLMPLQRQEQVTYIPYRCTTGSYADPIMIEPKKINIVEGAYSLHPTLIGAYDYKVFLTQEDEVQLQRIGKRCGEEKLQQFIKLWIPLENYYFNELDIAGKCDLVIDTSYLW